MEETKMKELEEKVEKALDKTSNDGITVGNVDYIYKLVDIHKDLENEKYWKDKKEAMKMRYRESYGRMRDSRGRYMESGRNYYGRDRYGRNYRGYDLIDEMSENYGNYSENRDAYGHGDSSTRQSTLESLTYMLQSVVEFMGILKQEAGSQEEVDLIKRYAQTLSDM